MFPLVKVYGLASAAGEVFFFLLFQLLKFVPRYNEGVHSAVLVVLLAGMGVAGYSNIKQQRSIIGEFSNYPMEELVEWIKASTPRGTCLSLTPRQPVWKTASTSCSS